ncbi:unnamed protein product [Pylaiella littoralis]
MAQTDREVLVALYNATSGPDWSQHGNWNTDADLSQWHGIKTNHQGRVVQLFLSANNLKGPIPPELGNLSEVIHLYLGDNGFSGTIPEELGKLTALQRLYLQGNNLSGPIPPGLGNVTALTVLNLSSNQLSGPIPPELGNLAALQTLNLSPNQLSGPIPEALGDLSQLRELYLGSNLLTGAIPAQLGALNKLTWLSLSKNLLSGFIPNELGDLSELQTLSLYSNELTGSIPQELGGLSELTVLWLSNNKLNGPIPPELGNLSEVIHLYLGNNDLSGPIPEALGALSKLKELSLGYNKLTGTIPRELGKLTALIQLYLNSNGLTGAIPAQLGALNKLTWLSLSKNLLSGAIPKELGDLGKLRMLILDTNKLTGPIPPELGNLAALTALRLQNNKLSEVPPEVLELCRARRLEINWADNPWSRPAETVLASGLESALGWWNDVKQFGEAKSNKLKMVLVGLENAGKTTIVRHFIGRSIPKRSDRTVGIEITPDWKPLAEGPLQVSVWDFAGQADYYASHQLFLTEGALFLLVVDLHLFSEEMGSDATNFTDTRGRVYWWLEMLHMRVPGAAIALVGSHVDEMKREEADRAGADLLTVVTNFIQEKASTSSRRKSIRCIDTEPTTTAECDRARDDVQHITSRDSFAQRTGAGEAAAKPLVLHNHVFKVSRDPHSVMELRQWIVRAASGRECPPAFNFPAVDEVVSKAWIEAYDVMDTIKKTTPYVLWWRAVEEFSKKMSGRVSDDDDAGSVLWRAMKHREAEGGVLLMLADRLAPVATDMVHLDPAWLIELVRRLSDHNLVDEDKRKRGTVYRALRAYADKVTGITTSDLVDMHSVYCKSGRLNRDFLRFLWMHREIVPAGPAIDLPDAEFEIVVSTMERLLVMYTANDANILVVPARLQEYGDQSIVDRMQDVVMTTECSFSQVFPPPGIVGRFLAWSAQQVGDYEHCWQHGAFFSYKFQHARYDVFLYEQPIEELHLDGPDCKFAGLVLGIQGPPVMAAEVLGKLRESLENLVSDPVYGYPGIAEKGSMYFTPLERRESKYLDGLRRTLDNLQKAVDGLAGMVSQLMEQELLAANDEPSEYPRLVLVRPELTDKDGETPERTQRAGWDRWTKALSDIESHKFRLHFLCEHDSSEVPCGPEGRGYLIEQPKEWVKRCLPLMQGSLWVLRVVVSTVSHVDLPLSELLGAFVKATGAELVDGVGKVPGRISRAAVPVFGEGATTEEIQRFRRLRGNAYEALCEFMRDVETSPSGRLSGCLPCCCTQAVVNWRDSMVQVENPRTRRLAWVLKTNKDAYVGKHAGVDPTTRASSF